MKKEKERGEGGSKWGKQGTGVYGCGYNRDCKISKKKRYKRAVKIMHFIQPNPHMQR